MIRFWYRDIIFNDILSYEKLYQEKVAFFSLKFAGINFAGINNHNFARIRINSYDSLPIEEISTFHYVIILIKPVITSILL